MDRAYLEAAVIFKDNTNVQFNMEFSMFIPKGRSKYYGSSSIICTVVIS
jgi:hypothetical protein